MSLVVGGVRCGWLALYRERESKIEGRPGRDPARPTHTLIHWFSLQRTFGAKRRLPKRVCRR